MFSFISPKLLTFYAMATGAVITLFSVTTSYGEAHLQAQEPISGRYVIAPATLPPCLQAAFADPTILVIQQSGRYVTGELRSLGAATPPLAWVGSWGDRHLALTATFSGCPPALSLHGRLTQKTFQGTLQTGQDTRPLRAVWAVESPPPGGSH